DGVRLHLPVDAKGPFGTDVARPVHIPMDVYPTAGTAEPPPPWCCWLHEATVTAGLGGIPLVKPLHLNAPSGGLLHDIPGTGRTGGAAIGRSFGCWFCPGILRSGYPVHPPPRSG